MTKRLTTEQLGRRKTLVAIGGGAVAVLGAGIFAGPALASAAKADAAMNKLIGGRATRQGRVRLKLPPIAEDGNSVPMTVSVDSPMTENDYVKSVHVVADGNPNPNVASFHFTSASGKAQVSTRIRMLKTQNIIAVAEMNDGTLYRTVKNVKVTIGGCGG
jgi:sulfur-oxidizing protein SoxY